MVSEKELLIGGGAIVLLYSLSRGTTFGISAESGGVVNETVPISFLNPNFTLIGTNPPEVEDTSIAWCPQLPIPSIQSIQDGYLQGHNNIMELINDSFWNTVRGIPIIGGLW